MAPAVWIDQLENTGGGTGNTFLLQENGFYLLLEDSGKIILDIGSTDVIWVDQNEN